MPALLNFPVPKQEWVREVSDRNGGLLTRAPRDNGERKPKEASEADRWEAIIDEIAAMQHLGDDWDGLGASAPSHEVVASAIGLAYLLKDRGVDAPCCVVPGLTGSVNLEWQRPPGTFAEVEIDRPLHAEVMYVVPGRPTEHWELPNA